MKKKLFPFLLVAFLILLTITLLCILTSHPSEQDVSKNSKLDFFHPGKKKKKQEKSNISESNDVLSGKDTEANYRNKTVSFEEVPGTTMYFVNTDSSKILWKIGVHTGYVKLRAGIFYISENELSGGKFFIDMDSIFNTDIDYLLMKETLENVLRSADWFSSLKYPLSLFEILGIKKTGKDSIIIHGSLCLLDKTRELNFSSSLNIKQDKIIALSAPIHIDRTDWGIKTMSEKHVESSESFIVPDSIEIQLQIVASLKNNAIK